MKIRLFLTLLLVVATVSYADDRGNSPEAKLTIKTLNDSGLPLCDMPVHVWLSDKIIPTGVTDSNGVFVAQAECTVKDVPIRIVKEGYYESSMFYKFPDFQSIQDNRWQPWNPQVTMAVRKVIAPIPMYAKNVETELPSPDQPVGYDLAVGDWVAPFGKGRKNDLTFAIIGKRVASFTDFDASMLLWFSNKEDGLMATEAPNPFRGSAFTWAYDAPTNGYCVTSNLMEICYLPKKGFFRTNEMNISGGCYFRVRTVTNDVGKIIETNYGKMPGFITFDPRGVKTATIQFTYYLNPTPNDRNMEFDPKRNLFTNLKSTEQVTAP